MPAIQAYTYNDYNNYEDSSSPISNFFRKITAPKVTAVALSALAFAMIGLGIAAAVGTLGVGTPAAINFIIGGVALLILTGLWYNKYGY